MIETLRYPNNVNSITQADMRGNQQNIAYFDADDGMQIGPNDPRITQIMQTPLNMFRPHVVADFNELTLDQKAMFTSFDGGQCVMGNGCATIKSALISGSGGRIELTNVPVPFVPGQRVYFYLTTIPNGNLSLEFGISDKAQFCKFSRIEDNVAQNYFAKVQTANGIACINTGQPGDSVRRLFCISIEAGGVRFYASTDMGVLQDVGFHPEIPLGNGKIFIDFKSRYPAPREVAIDLIYGVLIR